MKLFSSLKSPQATPGVLSFMLPGLGQVYQGARVSGVLFFLAFCVLLSFSRVRVLVPVLAIVSAVKAFRFAAGRVSLPVEEIPPEPASHGWRSIKLRTFAFAAVGIIAFLFWFLPLAPVWDALEAQNTANRDVDMMAQVIRSCRADATASYPASLTGCQRASESINRVRDPWGSLYRYQGAGDKFVIRSSGRDQKPDTADDLIYHFR